MTASRHLAPLPLLLIPWSVQAQSDPTDLTRPIVAGDPVAYPMGRRPAPRDPQVEAGDPALGVAKPPPVAGDRAPVLRRRAQSYRLRSRRASGSCLETHGAYRPSAGLHSCDCAYDIPKFTTARCGRVDSR